MRPNSERFCRGHQYQRGMDVERETIVEAATALGSVALFVAVMVVAGSLSAEGLSPRGAYTVIGGIVAFILVMAVAGYWLSTRE